MIDKEQEQYAGAFWSHAGRVSDKWAHYLPFYDRELLAVSAPISRVLEIGVQNGGCLDIWRIAYGNEVDVVGVDLDPRTSIIPGVVVGDATDSNQMNALKRRAPFDIIVDDGSHLDADIYKSFQFFWPTLSPGGVYFIEDLHAVFHYESKFPSVLNEIVCSLHAGWGKVLESIDGMDDQPEFQEIDRVVVGDSIAAVHKAMGPRLRRRVISGVEAPIYEPNGAHVYWPKKPLGLHD